MNEEDPIDPAASAAGDHWCVMRQDDNGHVAMIVDGLDREAAQAIAADFEARGHKQTYWIRRQ
ncbi:MAG: hypothetical protein JNM58_17250 [Xanthomonadaceae bacterium]|nr:hypothetical protein [Xanthomonadaceae bacterium]